MDYFSEMLLLKFIQSYLVIPIIDKMHCCRYTTISFFRSMDFFEGTALFADVTVF